MTRTFEWPEWLKTVRDDEIPCDMCPEDIAHHYTVNMIEVLDVMEKYWKENHAE